jgi:hypothetical protein
MEVPMSASNDKQAGFLGTYFDRDGVLRLSRWADIVAWIVLTIYLLAWSQSYCFLLNMPTVYILIKA